MNDFELLELAAMAAGIEVIAIVKEGIPHRFGSGYWNPLTNDGDALRLAVKLGFRIDPHLGTTSAGIPPCPDDYEDGKFPCEIAQVHNDDPYAATRRAIVRAAAEIGRLQTLPRIANSTDSDDTR